MVENVPANAGDQIQSLVGELMFHGVAKKKDRLNNC